MPLLFTHLPHLPHLSHLPHLPSVVLPSISILVFGCTHVHKTISRRDLTKLSKDSPTVVSTIHACFPSSASGRKEQLLFWPKRLGSKHTFFFFSPLPLHEKKERWKTNEQRMEGVVEVGVGEGHVTKKDIFFRPTFFWLLSLLWFVLVCS